MTLVDFLSAIGTDYSLRQNEGETVRTLQNFWRGVKVPAKESELDFKITTSDGQRQVDFDFGLATSQEN
jgi:hypothetical protein